MAKEKGAWEIAFFGRHYSQDTALCVELLSLNYEIKTYGIVKIQELGLNCSFHINIFCGISSPLKNCLFFLKKVL